MKVRDNIDVLVLILRQRNSLAPIFYKTEDESQIE